MFLTAFNIFHYVFRSVVPVILRVVFSLLVIRRLRPCRFKHRKRKTALSLLMVIISFVICATTDTVLSAVIVTWMESYVIGTHTTSSYIYMIDIFSRIMFKRNKTVNTLLDNIYLFINASNGFMYQYGQNLRPLNFKLQTVCVLSWIKFGDNSVKPD